MVQSAQCDCYTCSTKYYWSGEKNCPFISAVLDLVSDYQSQNNDVMDATNFAGMQVINSFADRKRSQIITESRQQESSFILEPRLVCKEGYISLSFKIGEAKLFVVKDLVHFADLVQKSETEVYGSNTTINHGIQNFTKDSRKWVEFIRDCVAEENRLFRSIAEITWRNVKKRVSDLDLYGWRIDRLYELVGSDGIRFEDRDSKKKCVLKCEVQDP